MNNSANGFCPDHHSHCTCQFLFLCAVLSNKPASSRPVLHFISSVHQVPNRGGKLHQYCTSLYTNRPPILHVPAIGPNPWGVIITSSMFHRHQAQRGRQSSTMPNPVHQSCHTCVLGTHTALHLLQHRLSGQQGTHAGWTPRPCCRSGPWGAEGTRRILWRAGCWTLGSWRRGCRCMGKRCMRRCADCHRSRCSRCRNPARGRRAACTVGGRRGRGQRRGDRGVQCKCVFNSRSAVCALSGLWDQCMAVAGCMHHQHHQHHQHSICWFVC
jgi:hypothetical protein